MTKSKKGFTIIEVVLVLAIAGLIFLMVFIALPALQRSQRNTRRRSDMARILSAFTEYQSNNGAMPSTAQEVSNFVKKYVMGTSESDGDPNPASDAWHVAQTKCYSDQFCDPDGTPYKIPMYYSTIPFVGSNNAPTNGYMYEYRTRTYEALTLTEKAHSILYRIHSKCSGNEGTTDYLDGEANISLEYQLEGGAVYCGDNQ